MQENVLSVSELNRKIRYFLEHEIGAVSVEGEISNLSKPASGHFYFTLKDASAQIRCVYFRNHKARSNLTLENGLNILAAGQLSLYEARGDYQLIVTDVQEAGLGDLHRQFELLKTKLAALGLFDTVRKKALPNFPNTIGIVSSATGAALKDILTTLARRYPLARVLIYPSEVQGKQAAPQLIQAIQTARRHNQCDVLILARGGGSIEDLWAFNDEQLAHCIAACPIPLVSGVGHETDFTIADFVADLRAATPTAAAEAVTPNQLDLMHQLEQLEQQLKLTMARTLRHHEMRLTHAMQRLLSPRHLILRHWQHVDYLQSKLHQAEKHLITEIEHRLTRFRERLQQKNPMGLVHAKQQDVARLHQRLSQQMAQQVHDVKNQFVRLLATLHAVSPLSTLDRGYAIARLDDTILREAKQVRTGDRITIRLAVDEIHAEVV